MKPYYYVYRNGGLGPKYKHETLESAKAEAERLALKCAGESFEILKCIGISSTQIPKASTVFLNDENPVKELPDGEKEFPFPEDFPELPPLPEGKSRWVYRGKFGRVCSFRAKIHECRCIMYWSDEIWCKTLSFSQNFHHIEAL